MPVKGAYQVFYARDIWITSNSPVTEWYKFDGFDPNTILRRLHTYRYVDMEGIHEMVDWKKDKETPEIGVQVKEIMEKMAKEEEEKKKEQESWETAPEVHFMKW